MYLCYIDESGVPDIPGNTTHFVLAGLALPAEKWNDCNKKIQKIKDKYDISESEIHTAWLLRPYLEQKHINNFDQLDYNKRRSQVEQKRKEILYLKQKGNKKAYIQTKKNFDKTKDYIHLTYDERRSIVLKLSQMISKLRFARLFAECIDKIYFNPTIARETVEEQAFEQLVSRFEQFLKHFPVDKIGMLIHDNNPTLSKRLTQLMKSFHKKGTLWTQIKHIIETPLFVDSELTSMIQMADLCSYALRRYLENNEDKLFSNIYKIADKKDGRVVGVRHFTKSDCPCDICRSRR